MDCIVLVYYFYTTNEIIMMTEAKKEKVKKLMNSKYGLISKSCKALGIPVSSYWNIMKDRSNNTELMQQIVDKAKEIKKEKSKLSI